MLPPVDFESTASTNSATPAAHPALPRVGPQGQVVSVWQALAAGLLAPGTGFPYSAWLQAEQL